MVVKKDLKKSTWDKSSQKILDLYCEDLISYSWGAWPAEDLGKYFFQIVSFIVFYDMNKRTRMKRRRGRV